MLVGKVVVAVVAVASRSGRTAVEGDQEIAVVAVVAGVDAAVVAVVVVADDAEEAAAVGSAAASSETLAAHSSKLSLKVAPSTKRWTPPRRPFVEEVLETLSDQPPC